MNKRTFIKLASLSSLSVLAKKYIENPIPNRSKLKPLNRGDKVALIAPGSPLQKGKLQIAKKNIEKLGLEYEVGKYAEQRNGYLAGTDEQRLADLHWAFEDKSIKAVWCIRGGYGCTRILPLIEKARIKNNPKPLIGYSDITALHLYLQNVINIPSFHAPVASSEFTEFSIRSIQRNLFSSEEEIQFETHKTHRTEARTIVDGTAIGKVTGGNLSLLSAMCGTPYLASFRDKIVFIEEIGEKPYRIDRMLTQLIQANELDKAAGIVLGQFTDCEKAEKDASLKLIETLQLTLEPLGIPCYTGASIGHVDNQISVVQNVYAKIDAKQKVLKRLETAFQ